MARFTSIRNYPVSHGKDSGGSGGGKTYYRGGYSNIGSDLIVNSITANTGNIGYLDSKSITANDAGFIYITSNEGIVKKISGEELYYNSGKIKEFAADTISAGQISCDNLDVDVKAWIKELNSERITTDYLTVTKQAHFFELIIDKVRSVGGQMILSAANCLIDYVEAYDANDEIINVSESESNIDDVEYFRVYWRDTDSEGRHIHNEFVVNDQAICKSFNDVHVGSNYNISNKYYWRLVTNTSSEDGESDIYINFATGEKTNVQSQATDNKIYLKIVGTYADDSIGPHEYSQDYFTFKAVDSGQFMFTGNNIQYSLDNGSTWNTLVSGNNTPTLAAGDEILWKASGLTPTSSAGIGTFSSTGRFNAKGNIMSLVYGDNFINNNTMQAYQFKSLFNVNTKLISAENLILPATTLADNCYQGMFYGCTRLYNAPVLPATTLVDYCYAYMFYDCTSLNSITCLATDISATDCTKQWVAEVAATGTFVKAASMSSWTTGNSGIPYSGWEVIDYNSSYDTELHNYFTGKAQTIQGVHTGVSWDSSLTPAQASMTPDGIMHTTSTLFGVQFDAADDPNETYERGISRYLRMQLAVNSSSGPLAKNLAISVYFADNTYLYFTGMQPISNGSNIVELDLGEQQKPIESIVVVDKNEVEWHLCHWMDLSNTDCDEMLDGYASMPSAGDSVVQLGYRANDDPDRQSAIIIAAYKSMDPNITAPSYAQYRGINNYSLSSHRHSYFDANGAKFIGDISLSTVGGDLITDVLDDINERAQIISTKIISDTIQIVRYEDSSNPGTYLVRPNTFNLSVAYYYNGTSQFTNTVPSGFRVYVQFFDENGNEKTDWRLTKTENDSLSNLTVQNSYIQNSQNIYIDKIRVKLCVDQNGTTIVDAPIIEIIDIPYVTEAEDGQAGTNGELYYLIAESEGAYAGIISQYNGTSDNCDLYVNLSYKVGHVNGSNFEVLNMSQTSYRVHIEAFAQLTNGNYSSLWYTTSNNGSFADSNLLATINPSGTYSSGDYRDYLRCYKNHRDRCPIYLLVQLQDTAHSNAVIDEHYVYVNLQSGAAWRLTDDGIVTAVASSNAYSDAAVAGVQSFITNNYSTTQQTSTLISQEVASQMSGYATQSWTTSQINQSANSISQSVASTYYNKSEIDTMLNNNNSVSEFLDLTASNFNQNNFYPVSVTLDQTMQTPEGNKLQYVFQVDRQLHDKYVEVNGQPDTSQPTTAGATWGCPSWGHTKDNGNPRGVDLLCNWSVILSAWGEYDLEQYINTYVLRWTDIRPDSTHQSPDDDTTKVIGTLTQYKPNSEVIFYLRGGSAYTIRYDHTGFHAVVHSTDYTAHPTGSSSHTDDRTYPVYVGANNTNVVLPEKDRLNRSEIQQTARSISLSVFSGTEDQLKRTGIDIESGRITLTGDNTDIVGNLNLKRSDNGIIVYDSNGNARINIMPDATPVPTAGGDYFNSKNYTQVSSNLATKSQWDNVNITTQRGLLGHFAAGNSISMTISPELVGMLGDSTGTWRRCYTPTISCTAKVYRDNSSSAVGTTTVSLTRIAGPTGEYQYPSFSFTVNNLANAGDYYLELTATGTEVTYGYVSYYLYGSVEYEKQVESLVYLGTDGLLIGSTNNHFVKLAKDSFELRWLGITNNVFGGTSIKMSNDGFQRAYDFDVTNGPRSWVTFDGYSKATIPQMIDTNGRGGDCEHGTVYYGNNTISAYFYRLRANDSIIFLPQNWIPDERYTSEKTLYICLGNGAGSLTDAYGPLSGRHVYIRNFSDCTVYVCDGYTSGHRFIMARNSLDTFGRYDVSRESLHFMAIPEYRPGNAGLDVAQWACIQQS